jgi:hypothetical protein
MTTATSVYVVNRQELEYVFFTTKARAFHAVVFKHSRLYLEIMLLAFGLDGFLVSVVILIRSSAA